MTSDETEEVGVGKADEAEGAQMAEVAEVAADEDELAELEELEELEDDFDWVAGFDEAVDDEDDADDAAADDEDEVEVDALGDADEGDADEIDDMEDLEDVDAVEDTEDTEDAEVEDAEVAKETEDDALMEDDESGWLQDPDVEGQERFWDGTEWTDQVRPVEEETDFRRRLHLPDHVPELQRALAAATADIDDVEARLSTLFERGEGKRGRSASVSASASASAPAGGPPIHEEFGASGAGSAGGDASSHEGEHPILTGGEGTGAVSGDDEETFAELDAALAAETPEKRERRFFKRQS